MSTYQPARWQAYAEQGGKAPTIERDRAAVTWLPASREWATMCPCGWASFAALQGRASAALAEHVCETK